MRADEYVRHDATGLASLAASGEVSAAELLDLALGRLDDSSPINPVSVRMDAIARARVGERLEGRFAGVPFLLKDWHQDYAGVVDTGGCRGRRGWVCATHSTYTQRCLDAGLVIFGRTATPELALLATTESALHGPTRNPWASGRSPGGSSGGAAASVAAGIVPMAGASDGGGSIRIPAGYCGLFGFRPGRGVVPSGPQRAEGWEGANSEFVITRSVRDAVGMLDVLAGMEPGAPFRMAPRGEHAVTWSSRLRIGFSASSPVGRVHAGSIAAVRRAAVLLEGLGHRVEEVPMPVDLREVGRAFLMLYLGQVPADLAEMRARTGATIRDLEPLTRGLVRFGRSVRAGAYVSSHRRWNEFGRTLAAFFETHDLLMLPTTAGPAPRIGELAPTAIERFALEALALPGLPSLARRLGALDALAQRSLERTPFTQLSNLTGTPSMSVPLHWEAPETGEVEVPFGVQFVGPVGGEGLLLGLAAEIEEAAPWRPSSLACPRGGRAGAPQRFGWRREASGS